MKMLYLSCHGVLEHDEVRMFSDMGFTVFVPSGTYQSPNNEGQLRPALPELRMDPEDSEIYDKTWYIWDWNKIAPREFIDRFDLIYVMGLTRWITHNWESFKHKPIVWRTIGQSNKNIEAEMRSFRNKNSNLKIARYSPTERNYSNYAGEDAMIRFSKRPSEWNNWNGNEKFLVTVVQSMKKRNSHCSWEVFSKISKKLPCKLYGSGNDDVSNKLYYGCPNWKILPDVYRNHRCYFYAGTVPANYTLNFIEAWMTGIPIVALGENMIRDENTGVYEIPTLIHNGVNGFVATSIEEVVRYTKTLFEDTKLAASISESGRKSSIYHFDESTNIQEWRAFFKRI